MYGLVRLQVRALVGEPPLRDGLLGAAQVDTCFASMNAAMPSTPGSRPMPLICWSPKGAAGLFLNGR